MEKKFGPMMQMAFVVNDFEEPINFWTKKMNIGPFFKLEHLNVKDVYYMDKPTELDFSVAIAYTGNMQIELVNQHCDTPSIYNEYVNNEKGPLHHLCTLTNDIENDIRILESQGYINLQGGKTQDDGKFAYLDTKEKEGPILEIAQLSEAGLGFFDVMHEASKNWDKNNLPQHGCDISVNVIPGNLHKISECIDFSGGYFSNNFDRRHFESSLYVLSSSINNKCFDSKGLMSTDQS